MKPLVVCVALLVASPVSAQSDVYALTGTNDGNLFNMVALFSTNSACQTYGTHVLGIWLNKYPGHSIVMRCVPAERGVDHE
jgi:hypothetical protein